MGERDPIHDRTLFERGYLTRDGRLLRLLLRRDPRINRDRFHRTRSPDSLRVLAFGFDSTTPLRICTRRIGATISYAKRSCSWASRVGSKRRLSWMGCRRDI